MVIFLEKTFARCWNWLFMRKHKTFSSGLLLGFLIRDDRPTKCKVFLSQKQRARHTLMLGRNGTGKSSLIDALIEQDIKAGRGFLAVKFHDDHKRILSVIAEQEKKTGKDLSSRTIIIDPSDPLCCVGLNPLEISSGLSTFIQIAEISSVIRSHARLESFGPQTEELLRNSLHVLADNRLTLIELAPFLTNATFRLSLMPRVSNAEVRAYFENRFDEASDAMRRSMTNPVLNKTSAFTADPHFRHILGQKESTFSLVDAIDAGCFIILALPKNRLGEQTAMIASVLLAKLKNSAFARKRRDLFTIYADEIQNLVSSESSLEVMFSELRKFGIGIVAANQYLDQYPPQLRSAVLAIGTHICFQLSSGDADKMASALDGGKNLSELLRNLPLRNFVLKTGSDPWKQVITPKVEPLKTDFRNLIERSQKLFAMTRSEIEAEIQSRIPKSESTAKEELNEWE
jgi:Type IV secretion-system coupling protein DNA-binding domain